MIIEKQEELVRGKAKRLYKTNDPDLLIMEFLDDTSAFDGVKKEQLIDKGLVNNKINAFIMEKMTSVGIVNHYVEMYSDTESIVKSLNRYPVECVVRNVTAGGICRRLGVSEGIRLKEPIFEFFLKNDELHDPMLNEDHIMAFKYVNWQWEMEDMKRATLKANEFLKTLFANVGLELVDFKLEYGLDKSGSNIVLCDEITPDGCRLWDMETAVIFDKDRFRKDLGNVVEYYKQVAERLGVTI